MKKLLLVIFLVLVGLGLVSFYILNNLHGDDNLTQREKDAALKNILGRNAVLDEKTHSTDWTEYKGKEINFSYPSWGRVYDTHSKYPIVDSFSFGLLDEHMVISIQVHKEITKIEDLPSFNVRANNSIYKAKSFNIDQNNCSGFEKITDGVEESIFCVKSGNGISFIGSGPDAGGISGYLVKIVNSSSF